MKYIVCSIGIFLFFTVLISCNSCSNDKKIGAKEIVEEDVEDKIADNFKGDFKVLSLNTWQEGTSVNNGFNALVQVILQSKADVVLLSEIRNYNNTVFTDRILKELNANNVAFHSFNSAKSPIILSKFPIASKPSINTTSLAKAILKLDEETNIAVYAAHLDYTHYACYLPRGYDGITWKKLPTPVLDLDKILKQNKDSKRDEAITLFMADAEKEAKKGNFILLGGDFNEPSHIDWTAATKDLFDHNGTIVPWHQSVTLKENGFVDSYREIYPNPVTYPGITWPANNVNVDLSKLVWTLEADERDRIDYIYYKGEEKIVLKSIVVVGPIGSIVEGQRVDGNPGDDVFYTPDGIWPSDHKGVLATFTVK